MDVTVATFNSARDLDACLSAVRRLVPVHRLLVLDRHSTDGTANIARAHDAELFVEESGLGETRARSFALAETEFVLSVDSDVIVRDPRFYERALACMEDPRTVAVVGGTVGHPFVYGLPFGLTLLRRAWARAVEIPRQAQGYESYFYRREVRRAGLRVRYVPSVMEHRSVYRVRTWPEWQGAQMRLVAGLDPYEIAYAGLVSLLISLNSRRLRNIAYAPAFYLKLLRGFLAPARWRFLDRRTTSATS